MKPLPLLLVLLLLLLFCLTESCDPGEGQTGWEVAPQVGPAWPQLAVGSYLCLLFPSLLQVFCLFGLVLCLGTSDELEFLILLPPSPGCWGYGQACTSMLG